MAAAFAVILVASVGTAVIMIRAQRRRAADAGQWIEAKLLAEDAVRHEMSLEVHDDLIQRLYGVTLALESGDAPPPALRDELREITEDLRRLSHSLHPPALDLLGLSQGLGLLVIEANKKSKASIRFHEALDRTTPDEWVVPIYRWVQEALRNAVTHAGASMIRVGLEARPDGLYVEVIDDGKGFTLDEATKSKRLGLRSLHGRLRGIGGRTEIHSVPGSTRVEGFVPWPS